MEEGAPVEDTRHCCISHVFFRVASSNLSKIAVVHGSGGFQICRDLHERTEELDVDDDKFFAARRESQFPAVYSGDRCFTFSDVLASVNLLCDRIRRVLSGGDDPGLIRPRGFVHGRQAVNTQTIEPAKIFNEAEWQLANSQSMHPAVILDSASSPQIVGIFIPPSVEYIVSVLAILRNGDVFLPLDPLWPKQRILSIISSSKIGLILTCSSSDAKQVHQLHRDNWLVDGGSSSVLNISMEGNCKADTSMSNLIWPCESRNPRLFCYLMYTSGSTGMPKGVCGTEKGLLNRFLWMQRLFPLCGDDTLLFKTSISFIDHLQEILGAILTGTPLIVPPFDESKANPLYLIDIVKAYNVTRLTSVPSLVRAVLPTLQQPRGMQVQKFLRMLVLSGEVLSIALWEILYKLLPNTSILNLYGSTEVSGDCTYFDCKNLPKILETNILTSVPIGVPVSGCEVVLIGESNMPDEGEICVGGACVSVGYLFDPIVKSLDHVKLPPNCGFFYGVCTKKEGAQIYFRTGDFARRLESGDLVFMGRKDRIIKVNGQRVALEEIENNLRMHPDVVDVAVAFITSQGEYSNLTSFIVPKRKDQFPDGSSPGMEQFHPISGAYMSESSSSSFRSWLVERLPFAMIPNRFLFVRSLPISSTGKVDYALLAGSALVKKRDRDEVDGDLLVHLDIIKEALCSALMVDEVAADDDFFAMGGNSIIAAQVAHLLGIDMRLLYTFSTPIKLLKALLEKKGSFGNARILDPIWGKKLKVHRENIHSSFGNEFHNSSFQTGFEDKHSWLSSFYLPIAVSFSRCNKVIYEGEVEMNNVSQTCWTVELPRNSCGGMRQLWKVSLGSCVDASPLIVLKDGDVYLFIGSHSNVFLCVDGSSGSVLWEVQLEGRVECSAAITDDFTLIIVGCYKGKIYFLDFMTGNISWVFQTGGEVKSQPVADRGRSVVWCGSYDHNLYALDYKHQCCIYTTSCGGSIYGSPVIDTIHNMLYVASTSGRVTAISLEALPFNIVWLYESGAPIFGSLTISSYGNVICCTVNGHVIALNSDGSTLWKAVTDGPVFAGACISHVLVSQVLICTRNGTIHAFESVGGHLLWEYHFGDPITSSAYIDENTQLMSETSNTSERLVCVCSSSGGIHVLRIDPDVVKKRDHPRIDNLEASAVFELRRTELQGQIFSSPVMIGGRIFVGCRDDHLYCIGITD